MTTSSDPPAPPAPHVKPSSRRPKLLLTAEDFEACAPDRGTSNRLTRSRVELKQRMLAWARSIVVRLRELGVPTEVSASDEYPSVRNGHGVDGQRVFFSRVAAARGEIEKLLERRRAAVPVQVGGAGEAALLADLAREPWAKHVFLGLRLDSHSVEVSIELDPHARVDVDNLRARLLDPAGVAALEAALRAVPEQFVIRLGRLNTVTVRDALEAWASGDAGEFANVCAAPEGSATPTPTPLALQARNAVAFTFACLLDASAATGRPLWLGWTIPRDIAITHASLLDEQLADAIAVLAPIYRMLAWARDNDLLDRDLAHVKAERARLDADEDALRAEAEWAARRGDERKPKRRTDAEGREARKAHSQTEWRTEADQDVDGGPLADGSADGQGIASSTGALPRAVAGGRVAPGAAAHLVRVPSVKSVRTFARRKPLVTDIDPSLPIDKGVRVRVLSGPFTGKDGVVQELDGKGGARVMLGLLAMWLEIRELVARAERRDRPVLGTSHRKPTPAR